MMPTLATEAATPRPVPGAPAVADEPVVPVARRAVHPQETSIIEDYIKIPDQITDALQLHLEGVLVEEMKKIQREKELTDQTDKQRQTDSSLISKLQELQTPTSEADAGFGLPFISVLLEKI
ncbi:unnamed protein product [Darwinula stevensoni]|uniref:Uncharacterized protein n=1 Tax=Darwinula stevensoni TaxID=69355 RepID=A0A7R9FPY5_9CRUS|nr:unnamed protein product [Darwinula stevensoni]CAG0898448.1 unnamed protein product [Darwinula stevensoni]